jgi:cellulose synthase/poly-beta-1,6-N-acetylglucosamine synthase-like glycosyltransferase
MNFWEGLFAASCFVVLYNYAGYAVIVFILTRFKKYDDTRDPSFTPTVSFIVAAFNEEDCIEKKIQDSLAQAYPADKIEYIFITDGSTDGTTDIIRRYPSVRLLHNGGRNGKTAALNRAIDAAKNDILIFSDANTFLNREATRNIASHYRNEKVGGVAGEKKVIHAAGSTNEVGAGEGMYWKYESLLKKLDSSFYSVVGAAGELFSLRRHLYEPVPNNVVLDDFVISLKVASRGYRILYEPEAYAMELPSFSIGDEQKRKVRIAAGGFQAMGMLSSLLRFWEQPKLSFLYISHRVLRWTLSPLCLILAFLSNVVLVATGDSLLYNALLLAQLFFYFAAFLGSSAGISQRIKSLKVPYYFVFMNLSVILGFFRFIRGAQPAAWEKSKRSEALPVLEGTASKSATHSR